MEIPIYSGPNDINEEPEIRAIVLAEINKPNTFSPVIHLYVYIYISRERNPDFNYLAKFLLHIASSVLLCHAITLGIIY